MAPYTFVMSNSPYNLSQISLASFVPNIHQPHQDAERSYQAQDSDYDVQDDETLDLVLSSSAKSHLKVVATSLVSVFGSKDKGNHLQLQATKGRIYTLKQPHALFTKIVSGDHGIADTQRWLEDCKQRGLTPRFVVAFRTLVDARMVAGESEGAAYGGGITAPVSAFLGDPTGISDSAAEARHESRNGVRGGVTTPGERIYAIAYRKVRLAYRRGVFTASLPSLENSWECFAAPRGESELDGDSDGDGDVGDIYIKADLQEDDDDEDCQTFLLPERGGEAEAFGIPLTGGFGANR